MNYSEDDNRIMANEAADMKDTAYPKYIKNRFTVMETVEIPEGYCAVIIDHEMGVTQKYHEGDSLADGKVMSIEEGGIVTFKPPRAEVQEFTLNAEDEMAPIGGHKMTKKRLMKDQDLKEMQKQGSVVIIAIDDDMDKKAMY